MHEHATKSPQPALAWRTRHAGIRTAAIVALALLGSVALPVVPIFLGLFLIVAVAVYTWMPDLQPYVQPLLRVPLGRASKHRTRLLLTAGAGLLLIAGGSAGATVRGTLRTEWKQRESLQQHAEQRTAELLARARERLSVGDVDGCELVLLEADALVGMDAGSRSEVDELLARIRRSGDSQAILGILTRLPQKEFDAFARGEAVPDDLELGERALSLRAVEIARAQMDEAQRRGGRR
jgi:hypothetical protein